MKFTPGEIVFVTRHSTRTYYLYRKYQKMGVNIVCACHLKHETQLIVDSVYEDGTVLLYTREKKPRLAVAYANDLEPLYEK